MTAQEWKQLPPLVPLRDVLAAGLSVDVVELLRMEVKKADQPVPFRRIAAIRLRRKFLYVRDTVSALLPVQWRN